MCILVKKNYVILGRRISAYMSVNLFNIKSPFPITFDDKNINSRFLIF